MQIISLRQMATGQKGIISKIKATGELGRRIRDLGLIPRTALEIRGRAPLNDPIAIRVHNFILTLRNNEADYIEVEVDQAA